MLSLCIAPSYANFGVNGGIDSDGRDDATNPSPSEEESEDEKKTTISVVTVVYIQAPVSRKTSCEESNSAIRCILDYQTLGRFV